MFKKVVMLTLILCTAPTVAMQRVVRKFIVSRQCKKHIEKVTENQKILSTYLQSIFEQAARFGTKRKLPSQLLAKHSAVPTRINDDLEMPATTYIKNIIEPKAAELDAAFQQKYAELKDIKQTWQWFTNYFEEHGIKKPFAAYKEQLVIADQQERAHKKSTAVEVEKKDSTTAK